MSVRAAPGQMLIRCRGPHESGLLFTAQDARPVRPESAPVSRRARPPTTRSGRRPIRAEAISRIAGEIRRAQAADYCPGLDPVLTASALSAMLEHFCYIWLGQGGERAVVEFDEERAIDTLATIFVQSGPLARRARRCRPLAHQARRLPPASAPYPAHTRFDYIE